MTDIGRIRQLANEKGIKMSHIASKLGRDRSYFANIEIRKADVPQERLAVVAEILDTTLEYLNGLTDVKEKPTAKYDDELNRINKIFSDLSEENRAKLTELAYLYLAEQRRKQENK